MLPVDKPKHVACIFLYLITTSLMRDAGGGRGHGRMDVLHIGSLC